MENNHDIMLGRIMEKLEVIENNQTASNVRLGKLEDNLSAAVWVFRTLKYTAMAGLALITFNWTSVTDILDRFKHG